jgi:hypothetical protein
MGRLKRSFHHPGFAESLQTLPVHIRRRRGKYRLTVFGLIARRNGAKVDGGGFRTRAEAETMQKQINAARGWFNAADYKMTVASGQLGRIEGVRFVEWPERKK